MFPAILRDGQSHFSDKKTDLKAKKKAVQLMIIYPGVRQKKGSAGESEL